jgi:hypothetical protein
MCLCSMIAKELRLSLTLALYYGEIITKNLLKVCLSIAYSLKHIIS